MIECLENKICKAKCCAAQHADKYVQKINKGKDTEQDFIDIILIDQYIDTLERYENSLSLDINVCDTINSSCLTEDQVQFILEQITTICGSCSCNCN